MNNKLLKNRNKSKSDMRNSNIELLRIIAMLTIVAHHYIVNSGVLEKIIPTNALSPNSIFAAIFGWGENGNKYICLDYWIFYV